MSVFHNNALIGSSGQGGGFNITDSLRFRRSASAYLSRTPASAGNQKTFTLSFWVKRGYVSTSDSFQRLFYAGVTSDYFSLLFDGSGSGAENNISLYVQTSSAQAAYCLTNAKFRDTSAWYHVIWAIDTTQATASNRIKCYINGVQQTFSTASYPTQNADIHYNDSVAHTISQGSNGFDGYLSEIYSIDGQALDPSYFGETNTDGVWSPIEYTGTYGTNGFHLPMNATRDLVSAQYLTIAGGGSGGSRAGGGGGAGGYLTDTVYLKPSNTYTVTVGAGGAAVYSMPSTRGNNGSNSSISGSGITTITSIGGGGGGVYPGTTGLTALSGGSGGGGGSILGSTSGAGAPGTPGQGNAGGNGAPDAYNGGGGGGAGSAGSNATVSAGGTGGSGSASSITGSSVTRAGGGGGAPSGSASAGGGTGGVYPNGNATAGTVNTGGGGGGARNATDTSNVYSGAGGSGVVILRLLTSEYTGTTTGSPTVTTDGDYTVLQFTSSGTYTA